MANLKILVVVPAFWLFACAGIEKPIEEANVGNATNRPGFVEEWTEDAERRRAEGQYMGYYSRGAYYRALHRRNSHLTSGH